MDSTTIVAFLESPQCVFCDLTHLKGLSEVAMGKKGKTLNVQQCNPGLDGLWLARGDGFWLAVHVSGSYIFLFFPSGRLKMVDVIIQNTQGAESLVKGYEVKLSQEEAVPADLIAVQSHRATLQVGSPEMLLHKATNHASCALLSAGEMPAFLCSCRMVL